MSVKKPKYHNDTVIEMLEQARMVREWANSAMLTTKFESSKNLDNVLEDTSVLKSSMDMVMKNLYSL